MEERKVGDNFPKAVREIHDLRAQLAAVTAERDELRAQVQGLSHEVYEARRLTRDSVKFIDERAATAQTKESILWHVRGTLLRAANEPLPAALSRQTEGK